MQRMVEPRKKALRDRASRLDGKPIDAARGSVQPAFYAALSVCFSRREVNFSPDDAAALCCFFRAQRWIK